MLTMAITFKHVTVMADHCKTQYICIIATEVVTTSEITQISFVLLHFLSTEGASILTVGSMTESHL